MATACCVTCGTPVRAAGESRCVHCRHLERRQRRALLRREHSLFALRERDSGSWLAYLSPDGTFGWCRHKTEAALFAGLEEAEQARERLLARIRDYYLNRASGVPVVRIEVVFHSYLREPSTESTESTD